MSSTIINLFELHSTPPQAADETWRAWLDDEIYTIARRAGFTTDHQVYAANYRAFFSALDTLDLELGQRRYLLDGAARSAADEWLAILLWLYGSVFYGLYKLNRKRLEEFSNLAHYVRDIFGDPAFCNSVDFDSLKRDYYLESEFVNPKLRVPLGSVHLDAAHDRGLRFDPGNTESDVEEDPHKQAQKGEWKRKTSGHRHRISAEGNSDYTPERGRYHLYIANNCPWCHRTALTRNLKGLEDVVSMDVLFYRRDGKRGWQFQPEEPGCTPDTIFGSSYISQIYKRAGSRETSVPVLWDRESKTIVSNESAEIIRMFDQGFGELTAGTPELYPEPMRAQIDRINAFTYHAINNGAYKAGFANGQEAYESAYRTFFDALDTLDHMLNGRKFLLGDVMTEADVRLFPTIFRFDPVYYTRFNLDQRMVRDIPSLQRWLDTMLAVPGIAEASNLEHCRGGYFGRTANNLVPLGPRDLA